MAGRHRILLVRLAVSGVAVCTLGACTAPVFVVTAGLSVAQLGTAAYANGALQSATIVSSDDAVAAAEAAIADIELLFIRKTVKGRKTVLVCEELGGRNISIEITSKTERICKIIIRVGLFGDQAMSRLILGEIQHELERQDPGRLRPDGSSEVPLIYIPESGETP